jgi:hypothetical protein
MLDIDTDVAVAGREMKHEKEGREENKTSYTVRWVQE